MAAFPIERSQKVILHLALPVGEKRFLNNR